MTRIFISYRRRDTAAVAIELEKELGRAFGRRKIYRDQVSLQPGQDWLRELVRAIASSDLLVALIGAQWVGETDLSGRTRIHDRRDVVRMEIATAYAERVPIMPVLVDRAAMPRPEDLPLSVARLTRINCVELSSDTLREDIARLVQDVRSLPRRVRSSKERSADDLVGMWASENPGNALLHFTFHADGTYEYAGILRQERPSGSMIFESYQAGEYFPGEGKVRLDAIHANSSRHDPDSPEENYVNRPERADESEYVYERSRGPADRLILVDRSGRRVPYRRVG
ncbi:TIR domain-containing protein [Nonomuraea fuscirosea]|uniref:TIR domain-containing protein n=1 Tax=Nonomuraea fuscirosea TaxID=1291556 RepID=A0A2T0MXY1_9ACTN|nr:toll/interleukin-1 receptor domain-containing protein [Nonomuraea fuscirosea]PRX64087.1 TIR domain-containing protein [Nonomuraea fuscirosea]